MRDQYILELLNDLSILLDKYQVGPWSEKIKRLRSTYQQAILNNHQQDKYSALEEIKDLFGGMGSFNDYTITHLHGDCIDESQEQEANRLLNNLRHKLADVTSSQP
jgi:hypothetical protein